MFDDPRLDDSRDRDDESRGLDVRDREPCDPRKGDLRNLREQGPVRTVQLDGRRDVVVVLTKRGRDLLDSHRDRDRDRGQTFYADLKKPREVEHDAQVFRAYLREAERLQERGTRIGSITRSYCGGRYGPRSRSAICQIKFAK